MKFKILTNLVQSSSSVCPRKPQASAPINGIPKELNWNIPVILARIDSQPKFYMSKL